MRKNNCTCDRCGKEFYKRPSQLKKYKNRFCSRKCFALWKTKSKDCLGCGKSFHPKRREQKFCSCDCACKNRKITKKGYSLKTVSGRLKTLRDMFGFTECMVDGCHYDKTYDVHRLVEGQEGGKYEVGNMFAVCPNHHAELHRKISVAKKLSDCSIKVKPNKNEEC